MTPLQRASRIKVVIKRDGPHCVWCSARLSATHPDATVDHALPYAKDGSNRAVNLLLACDTCNWRRGTTSLSRYAKRMAKSGHTVKQEVIEAAIARIELDPQCKRSVCAAASSRRPKTVVRPSRSRRASDRKLETKPKQTLKQTQRRPARKPVTTTPVLETPAAKAPRQRTRRLQPVLNLVTSQEKKARELSRVVRSRHVDLVEELAWAYAA
jgi:hypothetical protein